MSRGDQRDRDRAKNLAKQQAKTKAQGRAGDPLQRNSSDAAALEAKIAAKKAKQEQEAGIQAGTVVPVVRKKVPTTKKDSVDDLLSAGLSSTSKVKRAK